MAKEFTLRMTRVLAAPRAVVYRALTDPAQLARWWGPRGFTAPSVDFDPRVGGGYRIAMQPPDGDRFHLSGEFREVDPPARLGYTFRWDPPDPDDRETVVMLSLQERDEGTEVVLTQGEFATEARLVLHEQGWIDSFRRLEKVLGEKAQTRLRDHIRANIVGYVAVFLALGGTAAALPGSNTVFSDDITDDQVRSADVRNDDLSGGGLAAIDLRPGSVRGGEVADESLTIDDLGPDSVSSSEIEDGGVDTAEVEEGGLLGTDIQNDSLAGLDIDESSLGQVPSAALGGIGRSSAGHGTCDPESGAFVTCGSVSLNLPAATRTLIIGRIRAGTSVTGGVAGTGEFIFAGNNVSDSVTVLGVSPVVGPGAVSFGIDCNQDLTSGAIQYDGAGVTAVALSPN
jgi:uncharacterized protein YndB with AHSA1/START domain